MNDVQTYYAFLFSNDGELLSEKKMEVDKVTELDKLTKRDGHILYDNRRFVLKNKSIVAIKGNRTIPFDFIVFIHLGDEVFETSKFKF